MKRWTVFLMSLAVILCLGVIPAVAQRGHPGGGTGKGWGTPRTPNRTGMPERPSPPGSKGTQQGAGKETSRTHQKKTVSDLLAQNTRLSSQIETLTGRKAQDVCSEFKNLGQCVAAAHVAHNLGVDFSTLKGKLIGSDAESLGQAIHDLNPNIDAHAEAKKANKQAKAEMKESTS